MLAIALLAVAGAYTLGAAAARPNADGLGSLATIAVQRPPNLAVELLLRQGDFEAAEELYCKALTIAREQEAKLWELRAAASIARLLSVVPAG
jgi:hypothetical protein